VKGEANELRRLTETIWEGLFLGLKEKAEYTQKRVDKIRGITDATHKLALVNQSQSEEIKNEAAGGHKAALKTSVQVAGVQQTMNNVDQRTEKTGVTVSVVFNINTANNIDQILLLINIGEYWRVLAIFVIFADLLGTPSNFGPASCTPSK